MTHRDQLVLSSPDAFLAATPHLLGFTPKDSIVLAALGHSPTGPRQLIVTQRFDRPSTHGINDAGQGDLAAETARVMRDSGADTVIVSVWGDNSTPDVNNMPDVEFIDRLVEQLDEVDIATLDVLYTDGERRWSYGCMDANCCPAEGAVIPETTRTYVAAEFAYTGQAVATDRQEIEAELDGSCPPSVAVAIAELEAQPRIDPIDLRSWRESAVQRLHELSAQSGPLEPEQVAEVLVTLRDIRVRDTFLWDMAQPSADRHGAVRSLSQAVQQSPEGMAAPAATCLALQHYQLGDGARANIAVDRALTEEPDYSLGRLVRASLSSGLPPTTWSQAMSDLTREACMDPAATPAPAAAAPAPITPTTNQGLAL